MIDAQRIYRYGHLQKGADYSMAGIIKTYQKCPKCGGKYPSSKGDFPIVCFTCKTQPTKFFIAIYWKGKDYNIYRSRTGKTIHYFNDARTVLGGIRAEIKTFDPEMYRKQSSTTFKAFWQRFLRKYKGKVGTYAKLEAIGRLHFRPFHDSQMRDIKAWNIDEWWDLLKEKGLSAKYLNDCRQWLLKFFRKAYDQTIIERVPPFPDPEDEPETDVEDYLTEEEQLTVLDTLPGYDRPIYDFLFLTGVRVNEAAGLQRRDTTWDRQVTVIRHTIKRDGSLGSTKNKKKRVIPHVPEIVGCLKDGLSGFHQYAFVNKWGRRYSDDYLRDTFRKACETAGVKPIPLKNATRHSFGMGLLRKGFDIWQVSKTMGHSDIKMTENYAKMLVKEMEEMYGRPDKIPTTEKMMGGK
jgi:integrase